MVVWDLFLASYSSILSLHISLFKINSKTSRIAWPGGTCSITAEREDGLPFWLPFTFVTSKEIFLQCTPADLLVLNTSVRDKSYREHYRFCDTQPSKYQLPSVEQTKEKAIDPYGFNSGHCWPAICWTLSWFGGSQGAKTVWYRLWGTILTIRRGQHIHMPSYIWVCICCLLCILRIF